MIYLFHGEEEFLRAEAIKPILAGMGAPEMANLNTAWLDGRKVSLAEIQTACDVIPFLAERRLVIMEGLLARLLARKREGNEQAEGAQPNRALVQALSEYLERVPPETDLVLTEPQRISDANSILKRLAELAQKGRAQVKACDPIKKESDLVAWIQNRARSKGARLTVDAAEQLAAYVGSQLRLLDQELDKLMTYALDRPITPQDVALLVSNTREANIFQMVESFGQKDGKVALKTLRELLDDGQDHLSILGMIVRQFRLLLQVKDLTARGRQKYEVAPELNLKDWQMDRLLRQSSRYSFPQLEQAYDRLLMTDIAIKTGQMEEDAALELLVVGLSVGRS